MINEIYGIYASSEILRARANLAYCFSVAEGVRNTQIDIMRAKDVLLSGNPVLEAGVNSETMVYFERATTLLMTRLRICYQSKRTVLEGIVDYMSMMIHFMGGQVREREANNMVVIVHVSALRMVSKCKEIQSLVRSLYMLGRLRESAEEQDIESKRNDHTGTLMVANEAERITP